MGLSSAVGANWSREKNAKSAAYFYYLGNWYGGGRGLYHRLSEAGRAGRLWSGGAVPHHRGYATLTQLPPAHGRRRETASAYVTLVLKPLLFYHSYTFLGRPSRRPSMVGDP